MFNRSGWSTHFITSLLTGFINSMESEPFGCRHTLLGVLGLTWASARTLCLIWAVKAVRVAITDQPLGHTAAVPTLVLQPQAWPCTNTPWSHDPTCTLRPRHRVSSSCYLAHARELVLSCVSIVQCVWSPINLYCLRSTNWRVVPSVLAVESWCWQIHAFWYFFGGWWGALWFVNDAFLIYVNRTLSVFNPQITFIKSGIVLI